MAGELTFADLLPAELVLPEVPVVPVWLVAFWFIPVASEPPVVVELCDGAVVELDPFEPAVGVCVPAAPDV